MFPYCSSFVCRFSPWAIRAIRVIQAFRFIWFFRFIRTMLRAAIWHEKRG